jgi:hypothetical protein
MLRSAPTRRVVTEWLRVYAGIEGSEDEVEAITEAQLYVTPNIHLVLNNAIGITKKAADGLPRSG